MNTQRAGHVVLAPDKFKGSLTAAEVRGHLARGLHAVRPDLRIVDVPVADGGDGTVAAALATGAREQVARVVGPAGDLVEAAFAVRGDRAVVELASASGLILLPEDQRAPMTATSFGTGQLLREALDAGCRQVILGLGGSACTDGGAGMLQALGADLTDASGAPIGPGGAGLAALSRVDFGALDPRLAATTIVVACDVDNPLTGPTGAAATYAPQKGATSGQVRELDAALARWADLIDPAAAATPGAGAAGGVGFAALSVLSAQFRAGVDVVLDLVGLDERLPGAALVITGEGSIDEQTLYGKAPIGVTRRARAAGIPAVAVAGISTISPDLARAAGFERIYTLAQDEPDPRRSMSGAGGLVEQIAGRIATDWLV